MIFDATPMGSSIRGSITRGKLRFSATELLLPITVGGLDVNFRIRATEWLAGITLDRSVEGVIGGAIDVIETARAIAGGNSRLEGTLIEVLSGSADLMSSSTDPTRCDSLSIGMHFIASPAEISGSSHR